MRMKIAALAACLGLATVPAMACDQGWGGYGGYGGGGWGYGGPYQDAAWQGYGGGYGGYGGGGCGCGGPAAWRPPIVGPGPFALTKIRDSHTVSRTYRPVWGWGGGPGWGW